MSTEKPTLAIIGAGLAGLTIANLAKQCCEVTLYEKSRGVGGRMATRYHDEYSFDHGAQYFTIHTNEFRHFIEMYAGIDSIALWQARFAEVENGKVTLLRQWHTEPGHYVATPKMNSLAKALAKNINLQLSYKLTELRRDGEQWALYFEQHHQPKLYDWVILTAPAEQTTDLLPDHIAFKKAINDISMQPCFSLMLGLDNPLPLAWDVALVKNSPISWISINNRKPGRGKKCCLVVHSANLWAQQHLEQPLVEVQAMLLRTLQQTLPGLTIEPQHQQLHRWRYANCDRQSGAGYYFDSSDKIGACGDWCLRGRVESAYQSAAQLYRALKEAI